MAVKTIQCREHGGTFEIESRRGRPPVRCTDDNPCDMVKTRRKRTAENVAARTARTLKGELLPKASGGRRPAKASQATARRQELKEAAAKVPTNRSRKPVEATSAVVRHNPSIQFAQQAKAQLTPRVEPAKKASNSVPEAGPVTVKHNPSITHARVAREQLEPLGWELKGRAWFDPRMDSGTEPDEGWAEVVAARGTETLILRWCNGKLIDQVYNVWNEEKPSENGRPKSRLSFDPDEMSDVELVRAISGQKITWWNRIAKNTESAIIGEKVQIEHAFIGGTGDETARIVKFLDATGRGGFRAFHVGAMMKL